MSREIAVIDFNEDQVALIKSQIAPKATNDELNLFMYQAKRTGLDPLTRQIYAIHRNCKEKQYGKDVWVAKMTIQTSIDGFRVIAERSGDYGGQDEPIFEEVNNKPVRCKVAVYRFRGNVRYQAAVGVAYFSECSQNNNMWQKMPHIMLAKVAEALALRKAYPHDLSGLYTSDEMNQADSVDVSPKETTDKQKLVNLTQGARDDMTALCEAQRKTKAEEFFKAKKNDVEACGSIEEIEALFEDGKMLKKLDNYPALKDQLKDCKEAMIKILDPEEEVIDYTAGG